MKYEEVLKNPNQPPPPGPKNKKVKKKGTNMKYD